MERQTQIFTFGCGQTFPNRFVIIKSETKERCRQIMFDTFGEKWCMQYDYDKLQDLVNHHMHPLANITELADGRLVTEFREQTIIRL